MFDYYRVHPQALLPTYLFIEIKIIIPQMKNVPT